MTPEEFIARWKNNSLTEKGGAQPHFEDLCRLLNVEPPREYGEYCYEQDLQKIHGGIGFADVWKRGCFAWENKGPDKDLGPALMQLKNYSGALDNPPVLVVCNRERIEIHPCFTGYPSTPSLILIEDIGRPENIQKLRWLFSVNDVVHLRPLKSNAAITKDAAGEFAKIASSMRQRGLDSQQVAHFLIQCIFCMYAEDEAILHEGRTENPGIFTAILKSAVGDPVRAKSRINRLFEAMKMGGVYGNDDIAWFNGGLFNTIDLPELLAEEIIILRDAAELLDWRAIDPTIFGTLFERGLDPSSRSPLGAHYTDVETINKLIFPLIQEPLQFEWEEIKILLKKGSGKGKKTAAYKKAVAAYQGYLDRLRNFRVLDPACGSGNFLYLSMHALKDLEHKAQTDAEILGFGRQISIETGPANIKGIEINEYAAELARVTVWIGDIQWSQQNGRPIATNPILRSLDGIQHRDALIDKSGGKAEWPDADVIVGNPPFLGDRKMIRELGEDYTFMLRRVYADDVPGGADLVCYWFPKAMNAILSGRSERAGFVATNSIRGGANRRVIDPITKDLAIFNAWSDEPWINEGAAVRVSLVAFSGKEKSPGAYLNGTKVNAISSDLKELEDTNSDITKSVKLDENAKASFIGTQKNGPFDIPGQQARSWLNQPNPNGRSNIDVVKPWVNGSDITRRPTDKWIIDYGKMSQEDAALYEAPFLHVLDNVKPTRINLRRDWHRTHWWCHGDPRPAMKAELKKISRVILTPRVSKYRVFAWYSSLVVPDSAVVAITRSDDVTFGILHSRFHELWALRLCTYLGVGNDPRYTPTSTFETFPFPLGLTPKETSTTPLLEKNLVLPNVDPSKMQIARKIGEASCRLNILRQNWLNPSEWVERVDEVVEGYPDRVIPKSGYEKDLKKRTLTNLYNERPAWLENAHRTLDHAVAEAYGWTDYTTDMEDNEILGRLINLNHERAKSHGK